jgi:hypothetical protein
MVPHPFCTVEEVIRERRQEPRGCPRRYIEALIL